MSIDSGQVLKFKPRLFVFIKDQFLNIVFLTIIFVFSFAFVFSQGGFTFNLIIKGVKLLLLYIYLPLFIILIGKLIYRVISVFIYDDHVLIYRNFKYFLGKAKQIDFNKVVKVEYVKMDLKRKSTNFEYLVIHLPTKYKYSTEATRINLAYFDDKYELLKAISERCDCEMKKNGVIVSRLTESVPKT